MSYRIALPLLLVKLLHAVPLIFEQAQHDWSQVEATQLTDYQVYGNKSAIRYPFEFHSLQTVHHNGETHLVVGGKNILVAFKNGDLESVESVREFSHESFENSQKNCQRLTLSYCVNYITNIMDVGSNVTLCGTNSNEPQLFSISKANLFDDVWWQTHWGDNIAEISQAYRNRACPSIPCLTSLHVPLPQSNQLFMATVHKYSSIKADLVGSYTLEVRSNGRSSRERHTDLLNNPKFTFGTEYGDHIVLFFREDDATDDTQAPELTSRSKWPEQHDEVARIGFVCKETADLDTLIKVTLRCQIGDRHFPTLVAAQRIKNQIYGLFASKEETLRHSALCVYDLADINRQMRSAAYLDAYGKAQPWPPASLPKQRHPFTCADITDESREWLSENSHFAPVIVAEARLVAPPHKFGHFTTMLIDQIDGQIPVLFFGTHRGHVLKVGAFKSSEIVDNGRHYSHDKGHSDFAYRLIEAVNVTQFTATCDCHDDPCTEAPCEVIKELKLIQHNQSAPKHIIVAFNNCLVKIPVATCQHDTACCDSDPYCHAESGKCMAMSSSRLKARLRPFKACPTEPIVNKPCAVGNLNSYGNVVELLVSGETQCHFRLCQLNQNLAGKTVAGSTSRFEEGLPRSDLIKPAMIAAAEIVLHRKQDQSLDETLPIALQTSQMAVYPELVFQVSILRDKVDKLVSPNNHFVECHTTPNRQCGHQQFHSPLSRQIWPWMAQLLEAFSAECDELDNAHTGASRYNLCKKQNCRFSHVADIHTLFRSLANSFDWMPRFEYLPFEIDNTTRPFRFDFDPVKQMVTVGFHYSVDFCQLIGNPNVKYRSVKKAAHTMPSVKRALTMLAHQIKYKMETMPCHQKSRRRSYQSTTASPRCKAQLCDQISFVSNVTENLSDHEYEQFVSLFASHAECGPNQSLNIGTRRKLNKIFGREASKLLTIEPKE